MFLLNTLLGFIIAQVYDIFSREKESSASPKPFDIKFFLADTWPKMVVSVVLSLSISLAVHLNWELFGSLIGMDSFNELIYLVIGAVPELFLQRLKKKMGVLQQDQVKGYQRKEPLK